MNTSTHNKIEIPRDNWKLPKEKRITQSDLIEKYIEGLSDGHCKVINVMENELKELFKSNIGRAQKIGEEIFGKLTEAGLKPDIAYMKIEPLEKFIILYQIDASLFYSDKIIEGYKIFSEFQEDNLSNDFYIDLSFLPNKGKINNECLISDGFILHYEERP